MLGLIVWPMVHPRHGIEGYAAFSREGVMGQGDVIQFFGVKWRARARTAPRAICLSALMSLGFDKSSDPDIRAHDKELQDEVDALRDAIKDAKK